MFTKIDRHQRKDLRAKGVKTYKHKISKASYVKTADLVVAEASKIPTKELLEEFIKRVNSGEIGFFHPGGSIHFGKDVISLKNDHTLQIEPAIY